MRTKARRQSERTDRRAARQRVGHGLALVAATVVGLTAFVQAPAATVAHVPRSGVTPAAGVAPVAPVGRSTVSGIRLGYLKTETAVQPLVIDVPHPRLSWQLASPQRSVRQIALEVQVARRARLLAAGRPDVWSSGVTASADPWITYAGRKLAPRTRYFWNVRVKTRTGTGPARWSPWSASTYFETAFTEPSQWRAQWIAGPAFSPPAPGQCGSMTEAIRTALCTPPSPFLRTEFEIDEPVARARLYASGLGYSVYRLNGRRTSDAVLDPGFTDYTKRVHYVVHDVTRLLRQGRNALGVELGRGPYGQQSFNFARYDTAPWHADPRVRLELHVTHGDGSLQIVRSGPSWSTTDGPSRFDDLMRGETYDARRAAALTGWATAGYADDDWDAARPVPGPAGRPVAQISEPVRPIAELPFRSVRLTGPGRYLFDLGTNIAGSVVMNTDLPAGTVVTLRYGEKLGPGDTIDSDMIPGIGVFFGRLQEDVYTAREGPDRWRPEFSYKGFQYVEVTGLLTPPPTSMLTAQVWHNDVAATGTWRSSSGLANRIVRNTKRAVLNNLFWQPTDTPIYEKTGYTGDGQLMAAANNYLFDMQRFYSKWSQDVVDAQDLRNGELRNIVAPSASRSGDDNGWPGPSPGWDVALFNVPELVHTFTGDDRPLRRARSAMRRYETWITRHVGTDGVIRGACSSSTGGTPCTNGLGDWATVRGMPVGVSLDSTAWYLEMLRILSAEARRSGDSTLARATETRMLRLRADFDRAFWDQSIRGYRNDGGEVFSQHQQAIALSLGVAQPRRVSAAAASLVRDVRSRGHHLSTGIMGTRFLWDALTRNGYVDDAWKVATQTTYPSYGYWIDELGWSALGENWEADTRSQSHMMYGTVVQWFYQDVAGYRPLTPGWRRIEFRPEIPAGLDHVTASTRTVRGRVATSWRRSADWLTLSVTVPPGARGIVHVPARAAAAVVETGTGLRYAVGSAPGVRLLGVSDGRVRLAVGSGSYRFVVRR